MTSENSEVTSKTSEPKEASVEQIRQSINGIDEQILELLGKRREASVSIAQTKEKNKSALRDRQREEDLLLYRIEKGKSLGLDSHFVTRIFHEVIDDSVRLQRQYFQTQANATDVGRVVKRVAFQGIEGAYGYLAAQQHFAREGDNVSYLGCSNYQAVLEAVEKGKADFGILPIENTASGGINEVYDLLLHTQLSLVGEETCKVDLCLIGQKGASKESLKTLFCHPDMVMQCSKFLSDIDVSLEYFSDAALASKRLKESKDPAVGAITSKETARLFDLDVLQENVGNQKESYTRFLIVARKPLTINRQVPSKTSLVFSTAQEPGALVRALHIFEDRGINLSKLESRPILENPWEEMFYLDLEGNPEQEHVQDALDELTRVSRFIKILGSYPTERVAPTSVKPENLAQSGADAKSGEKSLAAKESKTNKPPLPKKAKGYKLASREYKNEDTIIRVKGAVLGGDNFTVIAGPCSVESEEQIFECARVAKECGATILRGGCFKPRTSPYSFQGLGWDGLDIMAEAGKMYDLPIVTEVLAPDDVERAAEKADIIQIGARNMQNFTLLSEVGKTRRPIMLKRGMSASIDDLLHASEYILSQGNQQVFFCERGIRTFETATRNTLDLSAVPVLKQMSHLPVIVDPSHAAGTRWLVPPLSFASRAIGAHGIMIEFHPEPEKALSDGPQSLYPEQLKELMRDLMG